MLTIQGTPLPILYHTSREITFSWYWRRVGSTTWGFFFASFASRTIRSRSLRAASLVICSIVFSSTLIIVSSVSLFCVLKVLFISTVLEFVPFSPFYFIIPQSGFYCILRYMSIYLHCMHLVLEVWFPFALIALHVVVEHSPILGCVTSPYAHPRLRVHKHWHTHVVKMWNKHRCTTSYPSTSSHFPVWAGKRNRWWVWAGQPPSSPPGPWRSPPPAVSSPRCFCLFLTPSPRTCLWP